MQLLLSGESQAWDCAQSQKSIRPGSVTKSPICDGRLGTLSLSLFCTANRAQSVGGGDASDGTGGETSLKNLTFRVDSEIGRVDNAATRFPVGADLVGVLGYFQTIADGKRRASLFNHLLGFVERVDGKGNKVGIFLLEFLNMRLEVGDLPDAVGSPDAAIEDDNAILTREIRRNIQPAAGGG